MHPVVRLKLALFSLGQTQYQLAARTGMSETRLSRIVRGRVEPTAEEKKRLAEAVGVSVTELFEEVSA